MDGAEFASRTLPTNNCKCKWGPGTPLPACGHLSHQLFVSLQHLKVLGQFPTALSAVPVPNSCQAPFITRQSFVFLFWKLESFRKKSGFPLKFRLTVEYSVKHGMLTEGSLLYTRTQNSVRSQATASLSLVGVFS